LSPFAHERLITERYSSVVQSWSTVVILTTKPASEHAHARLQPRLSWSWTVLLLPSDTHRNVLRPLQLFYFVTYLLTLPHVLGDKAHGQTNGRTWPSVQSCGRSDMRTPLKGPRAEMCIVLGVAAGRLHAYRRLSGCLHSLDCISVPPFVNETRYKYGLWHGAYLCWLATQDVVLMLTIWTWKNMLRGQGTCPILSNIFVFYLRQISKINFLMEGLCASTCFISGSAEWISAECGIPCPEHLWGHVKYLEWATVWKWSLVGLTKSQVWLSYFLSLIENRI
jgi:hypothetical protein